MEENCTLWMSGGAARDARVLSGSFSCCCGKIQSFRFTLLTSKLSLREFRLILSCASPHHVDTASVWNSVRARCCADYCRLVACLTVSSERQRTFPQVYIHTNLFVRVPCCWVVNGTVRGFCTVVEVNPL